MSNLIAVIVEGEKFEKGVLNNFEKIVLRPLNTAELKYIKLPASANIYMIWKEIKEDKDIDIIELLREKSDDIAEKLEGIGRDDFSEVYLFFDFDTHQKNLPSGVDAGAVVNSIIDYFDNETENGKMFISYPMAEAIRDFKENSCEAFSGSCVMPLNTSDYKYLSGNKNYLAQIKRYNKRNWQDVILCYRNRLSRLFNTNLTISSCKHYSPIDI